MRESRFTLLVALVDGVAVAAGELVALGERQVRAHHFRDQLGEADLRLPAELRARLGGVAEQRVHFRRAEVARVDAHDGLARLERRKALGHALEDADLLGAFAFPGELELDLARGALDELAHAALLAGSD